MALDNCSNSRASTAYHRRLVTLCVLALLVAGTAIASDFDAVATHEIGHALGFDSDAGENFPKPSVWDLYRFRTGTTSSTFPTAQRILTVGGSPDPFQYDFIPGNVEIGLSTGGPTGSSANGGDGWQSSHWKHVSTCSGYIGIMDPAIPNGCRRTITNTDTLALTSFGYNLTNSNPPPPPPPSPTPPPNDNFANAQIVTGCSGSVTGSTFGATKETGEPSHDPSDATSLSPSHSIWYQWQAPSSGTTTITTQGSDFDTILAVYTVTTLSALSQLTSNDDVQNGIIRTSSVTRLCVLHRSDVVLKHILTFLLSSNWKSAWREEELSRVNQDVILSYVIDAILINRLPVLVITSEARCVVIQVRRLLAGAGYSWRWCWCWLRPRQRVLRNSVATTPNSLFEQRGWQHCAESLPRLIS